MHALRSRTAFEEKFSSALGVELRRQGLAQKTAEIQALVARHMCVITANEAGQRPSSDDDSSGSDTGTGQFASVFELDLSAQHIVDKVAIAVCEVLLKDNNTTALGSGSGSGGGGATSGAHANGVDRWRVKLNGNSLTDRCTGHLALLIQSCAKLVYLDVTHNNFSEDGKSELLSAIGESPYDCEVHFDVLASDTSSYARSGPDVPISVPTPAPSPPPVRSPGTTASAKRAATTPCFDFVSPTSTGSVEFATAPESSRAGSLFSTDSRNIRVADSLTSPQLENTAASAHEEGDGLRARSPSIATTTSAASRSTFASGSAEALRKRRVELFGRPIADAATAAAAAQVGADAPPAQSSSPSSPGAKRAVVARTSSAQDPTSAAVTPSAPPESSSPFRGSKHSPQQPGGTTEPLPTSREPFERNDKLDLTANLSPVLDSVLDLSELMHESGSCLRQPEVFGGAQSVWDVIEAYEAARGARAGGGESANRSALAADISAKLPPVVIGTDAFNALTVLNLSGNHLREMRTLPSSLLRLDVSNNELTSLKGLHQCRMLTVLNARRNRIQEMFGMERNPCLAHLFLGRNEIRCVEGVAHLLLLETLDLTHNKLATQSSVRALSLCGSLRHLLIKENPFVASLKDKNYKPLIRNLCPTLLVLDDVQLAPSRYADAVQQGTSWRRQPMLIDTRQTRHPTKSAEIMLTSTQMSAISPSRLPNTSVSSSVRGGAPAASDAESEQHAMNLLYLLTRGVTAPTGYGDGSKAINTAKCMAKRETEKREAADKKKSREATADGKVLRVEMMKKLAAASKKYLETTIVDRMTIMQQQQQEQLGSRVDSGHTPDATPRGVVNSPSPLRPQSRSSGWMEESPINDVMGYARAPLSTTASDADVLRAYQPTRFKAPATRSANSKSKSKSKSSARGSMPAPGGARGPLFRSASQSASPARTSNSARRSASSTAAPPQRSRTTSASPPQRSPNPHGQRRGPSPTVPQTEEATLEEMFIVGRPFENPAAGQQAAPPGGSYAAMFAAERQRPLSGAAPSPARTPAALHSDPTLPGCSPIRCFDDSRDISAYPTPSLDLRGRTPRGPAAHPLGPFSSAQDATKYPQQPPQLRLRARTPSLDRAAPAPREPPCDAQWARARDEERARRQNRRDTQAWRDREASADPPPARTPESVMRHYGPISQTAGHVAMTRLPRVAPSGLTTSAAPSRSVPVQTGTEQRQRVEQWAAQLREDAESVQAALRTVVQLLVAQRQRGMEPPESSTELPPTYLQERRRCVEIIQESGMLLDTQVPMDVVVFFGFGREELESGIAATITPGAVGDAKDEDNGRAREEVLRVIRLFGDAKTCLKYMLLLIGDGRERLLQQYVEQVKASLDSPQS